MKARVVFKCGECAASAAKESDVKHSKDGCKGKVSRTCDKSGAKPHVAV